MEKIKDLHKNSTLKYILFSFPLFFIISSPILLDQPALFVVLTTIGLMFFYFTITQFKLYDFHFLIGLIFLSILFPSIEISSAFPRIRIEEIIFYGFFPIIIIKRIKESKLKKNGLLFLKIYSLFLGLTIISTIYGKLFLKVPVGRRDIFEIITLGKYLLAFLGIYLMRFDDAEIKKLFWFVLIIILVSGVFGMIQFFGVFGIDSYIAPLYLQEKAYKVNHRLLGTFMNPNVYSVILVLAHIIAITLFFFEKEKLKRLVLIFAVLFLLICLLFAGSRTMIATYGLISIILFQILFSNKNIKLSSILLIISILSITLFFGFSILTNHILGRLESGIDVLGDESFGMRIIIWFLNLKLFLASPVLGWGPAKDLFTTIVDNEFILILRRYGVLGFLSYILIYLLPLYKSFKSLNHKNEDIKIFSIIMLTSILALLIACLTNSVLHIIQMMDFWIVMLALFFTHLDRNLSLDKKLFAN